MLNRNYNIRIFGIRRNKKILRSRIDKRVENMFKQGLLTEVKKLIKSNLSKTASFAIGIREIKGFLNGEYDLEEAKRLIKHNTHLYAKRCSFRYSVYRTRWPVNAASTTAKGLSRSWANNTPTNRPPICQTVIALTSEGGRSPRSA